MQTIVQPFWNVGNLQETCSVFVYHCFILFRSLVLITRTLSWLLGWTARHSLQRAATLAWTHLFLCLLLRKWEHTPCRHCPRHLQGIHHPTLSQRRRAATPASPLALHPLVAGRASLCLKSTLLLIATPLSPKRLPPL